MDLVAASFSLTSSLLDLSSSDASVKAREAVRNWLTAERVGNKEFGYFCQLARNLAHPNQYGWEVLCHFDKVDQTLMQRIKDLPIRLVAGETFARALGRDPEFAYIITTVATLGHYHDTDYTVEVLRRILMDKRGHENGVKSRYHWANAALHSIISKIVLSVYLNTTNASKHYNLPDLPPTLKSLEWKLLPARILAAVTQSVASSDGNVLIRSEHFFADLTHWLYFHFDGTITVVKNSRILSESRGTSGRTVTLLLAHQPSKHSKDPANKPRGPIEVSLANGPPPCTHRTVLRDDVEPQTWKRSWLRKPFYELNDLIQGDRHYGSRNLDDKKDWEIRSIASEILAWILSLPIDMVKASRLLQFDVGLRNDGNFSEGQHIFYELFPRSPRLLRDQKRTKSQTNIIFKSPMEKIPTDREGVFEEPHQQGDLECLLVWFPRVASTMRHYQQQCSCQACLDEKSLDECKPGCYRQEAAVRLLLNIAHGLGDAMGGIDVSGDGYATQQSKDMLDILYVIIEYRAIHWDTMFALVASVLSGVHGSEALPEPVDESSSWVALQNGSFVVLASWLDLKKRRQLNRVFSLEVLEGARIDGLQRDVGIFRSEGVAGDENHIETENEDDRYVFMDTDAILALVSNPDSIKVEFSTAVFHIEDYTYHLLTLVKADQFMRNVDVTLALLGYLNCIQQTCDHKHESNGMSQFTDQRIVVDDFDRALGTWGFTSPHNVIQSTKLLVDPLKVNAVLSACPEGCVVRYVDRWCFDCAIQCLKLKKNDLSVSETEEHCLRIINVNISRKDKFTSKKQYLED